MCTVTWLRTEDGYELFCNRDERHARAPAEAPSARSLPRSAVLAPTDPDGGGTWVSVNDRGLALCLLNAYVAAEDAEPDARFRSRGLLLLDLADAHDARDVTAALHASDLDLYRSFRLLVLDPAETVAVAWDRAAGRVATEAPTAPLVSCPVRTAEVADVRRRTLDALVALAGRLDADVLDAFHRSRHAEGFVWSVSMTHERAATQSYSRVRVDGTTVRMRYAAGLPHRFPPATELSLPRRVAALPRTREA